MATLLILLGGILIATSIFASTLWSAAQSLRTRGLQQYAHIGCAVLTTVGMAALALEAPSVTRFIGFGLLFAGILAIYEDTRWFKVLPLVLVLFSFVLIAGLPLAAT